MSLYHWQPHESHLLLSQGGDTATSPFPITSHGPLRLGSFFFPQEMAEMGLPGSSGKLMSPGRAISALFCCVPWPLVTSLVLVI